MTIRELLNILNEIKEIEQRAYEQLNNKDYDPTWDDEQLEELKDKEIN